MPRPLLIVQEVMPVKEGRLMLGPNVRAEEARRDPVWVELRNQGSVERVQALILPAFVAGETPRTLASVVLVGVARNEVPPGTEVWLLD